MSIIDLAHLCVKFKTWKIFSCYNMYSIITVCCSTYYFFKMIILHVYFYEIKFPWEFVIMYGCRLRSIWNICFSTLQTFTWNWSEPSILNWLTANFRKVESHCANGPLKEKLKAFCFWAKPVKCEEEVGVVLAQKSISLLPSLSPFSNAKLLYIMYA